MMARTMLELSYEIVRTISSPISLNMVMRELEERKEGLLRRIHILALQQNEQKKNC